MEQTLIILTALLVAAVTVTAAESPVKMPNVLVIITDQQHAGMLSSAGNPWLKTPAMDSLAETGARFERAYCVNPVCVPSRTGMFTGHTPARLGIQGNGDKGKVRVPADIQNEGMGMLFRRAGYEAAYCGKVHIIGGAGKLGFTELKTNSSDDVTAATAAAFIKQAHEKPFLLVASFVNPHDICYMESEKGSVDGSGGAIAKTNVAAVMQRPEGVSDEEFYGKLCPPLPMNSEPQADAPDALRQGTGKKWGSEKWREYLWAYHRLTEQVDREIGKVLEAMRDAGLEENTLVVFTSDHGDMAGAHGLRNKGRFFEESAGVPFIVSLKGVTKPLLVDSKHLVSSGMDLIPTVCDFAGIPAPESIPGKSVRALAEGRPVDDWRPYVVSETHGGRMVCSGRYKYCVYESGNLREQLVDLETDPGEMKNLSADPAHAETLARHRQYLREWVAMNHDRFAAAYMIK